MIVMKFGGTSVATFEAVSRTISIVRAKVGQKPIVCVSALSGVTDSLYAIADAAAYSGMSQAESQIASLRSRHLALAQALLSDSAEDYDRAAVRVNELCDNLTAVVASVAALGELPERIKAVIISFGELLSSSIICFAMNRRGISTSFVDARKMIITDGDYLKGVPQMSEIARRVPEVIGKAIAGKDAVITQGFISATATGAGTVLGRGGSDYSASLIGAALGAEKIEIWTDVDGIRSCDPRIVTSTHRINRISFAEAAEMAKYGAKVLHPMTIAPAVEKNIPLAVLNSKDAEAAGTLILRDCRADGPKAIAFKRNVYLLDFSGISYDDVLAAMDKYKIETDILILHPDGKISATADFSQNVGKLLESIAGESDLTLCTGYAQISIIGSCLSDLREKVTEVFPQLEDSELILSTPSNLSFVLPRTEMEDYVKHLHHLLFEL